MSNKLRATHVIDSIETKPDAPENYLHAEIESCQCVLLRMEPGEFGWFAVEPESDTGRMHRVRTSKILDVQTDSDVTTVETQNTFYHFRAIKHGDVCRPMFDPSKWLDGWEDR